MRAAQMSAESEGAAAALLRAGLTRAASRVTALHALHSDCAPLVSALLISTSLYIYKKYS